MTRDHVYLIIVVYLTFDSLFSRAIILYMFDRAFYNGSME